MPKLSSFSVPAFIQDFPEGSPQDADLKELWNINIEGWITQAMPPTPSFFYDPTKKDIPTPTTSEPNLGKIYPVQWSAFPGRLDQYYSKNRSSNPPSPYQLSDDQLYQLADLGNYTDDHGKTQTFGPIPKKLCPQAIWPAGFVPGVLSDGVQTFGPYGPRGWLDEYCEWSAARDGNGNLIRIDFSCENPEYWNSLWKIDPAKVVQLYNDTLNFNAPLSQHVTVTPADLSMPFKDPDTQRLAYNPLNKWNSGPVAIRTGDPAKFTGGVMHLTSTPNTLQTELGLAGSSTPQYLPPSGSRNDPQVLICCGKYGQEYRNSDPHIGFSVNQIVGGSSLLDSYADVCLANPVGLYLQNLTSPDNFKFGPAINPAKLPAGAAASDIFQIVRGSANVVDPVTGSNFPGSLILHVACQIPAAWLSVYPNLTLKDILIGADPIKYAGQIARQFQVGLYVRPVKTDAVPKDAACSSSTPTAGAPQQCMFTAMWDGYYNAQEEIAPTGMTMRLASNTTFIAPKILSYGPSVSLVVICNKPANPMTMTFVKPDGNPDPNISGDFRFSDVVQYAVPGNSYPDSYSKFILTVTVKPAAATGYRGISIKDQSGITSVLPAAIYIVSRA